jgi:hypothetical protein
MHETNAIDNMIHLLETIEKTDLPDNSMQNLNTIDCIREIINKLLPLANTLLIDDNGINVWENHDLLDTHGFRVFPGEQDRFGWLTGCIQTKKGFVVYG